MCFDNASCYDVFTNEPITRSNYLHIHVINGCLYLILTVVKALGSFDCLVMLFGIYGAVMRNTIKYVDQ